MSTIDVTFSEPIDPATFTTANLSLRLTPYTPYGANTLPNTDVVAAGSAML